MQNWESIGLYLVGIKKPFHDPEKMAALRSDINFAFRTTRSLRSAAIYGAARILGESGVKLLRATYRLAPSRAWFSRSPGGSGRDEILPEHDRPDYFDSRIAHPSVTD
jgi:hypothetical protein